MILLFYPPPGEALRLLKKTLCQSGLILAETHPLQGELADATARAYASLGTHNNDVEYLHMSCVVNGVCVFNTMRS